MSTYIKEWRAVGIDIDTGGLSVTEDREEGRWRGTKAEVREDVADMRSSTVPYDSIIVERRKVSAAKQVRP